MPLHRLSIPLNRLKNINN